MPPTSSGLSLLRHAGGGGRRFQSHPDRRAPANQRLHDQEGKHCEPAPDQRVARLQQAQSLRSV